ncbi:MAG: phage terminase large subunit [Pseudomonadota bacterium]|jgi:predicted phage terminase large subunit-like protein|nr:phage terminase large subunit [Pseudomonadota bacterium]
MIHDIDAFDAALRTDFASFLQRTFRELEPGGELSPGWHLGAIAWKLDQVRQGKVKRLLITMPPRSLKSMTVSVAFPAYLLGHDPTCRVITASYGEDLSGKHARDCRTVMQSPWYRRVFSGTRIARNRAAEHDFQTTRHGGRLSTTVGGAMTGRGGDILIIDDPIKAGDALSDTRRKAVNDWFSNTALTRLNDKRTGAVIVVMQRLHDDDLAAHLLTQGGWDHLDLPAIAQSDERIEIGADRFFERKAGEALQPDREPLDTLGEIRRNMSAYDFSAQYLQRPVPLAGNLVRPEWLKPYDRLPEESETGPRARIVQSWDLAVSDSTGADYSVCITALVRGKRIWVLDVYRDRINYPAQKKKLIALARHWQADVVLVEKAANGTPLLDDLRQLDADGVPTPIGVPVKGSKLERLSVQTSRLEAGDVMLPAKADWRTAFLHELAAFPTTSHDDQVDALSQLMAWTERASRDHGIATFTELIYLDR